MSKVVTNIVFDTTYILPIYGITVDQIKALDQDLSRLLNGKYPTLNLFLPSICTLEAMQQVIKEYKRQNDPKILERYSYATDALTANQFLSILNPLITLKMNLISMRLLSSGHKDIYDCLIAGCALSFDSIFVTEDNPLKKKMLDLKEHEDRVIITWNQFKKIYL